jgi:hypothetical protein
VRPLEAEKALTTLLSLEGFFFTAVTVSVSLARSKVVGEERTWREFALAISAVVVLAAIASAAFLAWLELFTDRGRWPTSYNARAQAVILAAAIVAQPLIAFLVALSSKPRR